MNDTRANQWVPVSERLPENFHVAVLVRLDCGRYVVAYRSGITSWAESWNQTSLRGVTHWMDLPELPAPPKPADPFKAWWESYPTCETQSEAARAAWNAAKAHYAKPKDYQRGFEDSVIAFESMVNRILEGKEDGTGKLEIPQLEKLRRVLLERLKPLPDFETWAKAHCADGPYLFIRNKTCLVYRDSAQDIWNAAQGKPEA